VFCISAAPRVREVGGKSEEAAQEAKIVKIVKMVK
jgi:hypothetical protein